MKEAIETLGFPVILEELSSYASNPLGKERCLNLSPSTSVEEVTKGHELVQEMRLFLKIKGDTGLSAIEDIRPSLQSLKVENHVLEPKEILAIRVLIYSFENLARRLDKDKELFPGLSSLVDGIPLLGDLAKEIEAVIDNDGEIKDGASPLLAEIRRQKVALRKGIVKKYDSIKKEHQLSPELEISYMDGRYVLALRIEDKAKIKGIIHHLSRSRNTCYIEPFPLVADNNRLNELQGEEREEIYRLLLRLSKKVAAHKEALWAYVEKVSLLDCLWAKARYAEEYRCVVPIVGKYRVSLISARNPLLLLMSKAMAGPLPVPIDLKIGPDSTMLLLCGPNKGGKTIALKSLGLLALMNQIGMPLPVAEGSELPVFKDIMAEIGDEQDVFSGQSTFSAHITKLKAFLERAESGCLVLIDEPGTGTSPECSPCPWVFRSPIKDRGHLFCHHPLR